MTALSGFPLADHLRLLETEYKFNKTIYGYPDKKIFKGIKGYDFSANLYGEPIFTPFGPAAGPHTQLAQNIVTGFLAGARIFELKTIQVNDQLQIPRPCIDIRNIGYNIEWSQELTLNDSLREYVKAWLILKYLEKTECLEIDSGNSFYQFLFDVSIGYDYAGITSPQVTNWLHKIKNPTPVVEELTSGLPAETKRIFNNIDPNPISESVTLSTFHGCPPDEIERMAGFLLKEAGFHVIIKFNPTLLGYERVSQILNHNLGYENLLLNANDFKNDLQFTDAIEMMKRLQDFAHKHNQEIGAKFTNTLIVKNTENVFQEPVRYLSGPPLYVIAMQTLYEFRKEFESNLSVSFSGGIDKDNFAPTLAGNILPVTTCTDILKKGGYTRLNAYLHNLHSAMVKTGVNTLNEFILKHSGSPDKTIEEAGLENIKQLLANPRFLERYHYKKNANQPKKTKKILRRFDCINCDICLKVCPNMALTSIDFNALPESAHTIILTQDGYRSGKEEIFKLNNKKQIIVIRDACNSCGNCQTFCPELGDPQQVKLNFFRSQPIFSKNNNDDGFYVNPNGEVLARFSGQEMSLVYDDLKKEFTWRCFAGEFILDRMNNIISYKRNLKLNSDITLSITPFLITKEFLLLSKGNKNNYPFVLL